MTIAIEVTSAIVCEAFICILAVLDWRRVVLLVAVDEVPAGHVPGQGVLERPREAYGTPPALVAWLCVLAR